MNVIYIPKCRFSNLFPPDFQVFSVFFKRILSNSLKLYGFSATNALIFLYITSLLFEFYEVFFFFTLDKSLFL